MLFFCFVLVPFRNAREIKALDFGNFRPDLDEGYTRIRFLKYRNLLCHSGTSMLLLSTYLDSGIFVDFIASLPANSPQKWQDCQKFGKLKVASAGSGS
jgi:hypothetical protein